MKKSRSSTPRFDARLPGLLGTGGPAREACEEVPPRVAIAVGNTLRLIVHQPLHAWQVTHSLTMKGLSCLQTCLDVRLADYPQRSIM